MGQDSKITWTTHTANFWRGCTKVSDGCKFCYADTLSVRNPKVLGIWGPNGTRVIAAESYWKQPIKWNEAAKASGVRHRVFCASLADVFEGEETMPDGAWPIVQESRRRMWDIIYRTQNLDWLLLTKRPQNIATIIGGESGAGLAFAEANMRNIWFGTSTEDQRAANERCPHLEPLSRLGWTTFLSAEPLLGPINLPSACFYDDECPKSCWLDWIITGSESGSHRRLSDLAWHRSLRDQCKAAGIAYFEKQMEVGGKITDDIEDFPVDLRIQEFPKTSEVPQC